MDVLPTAPAGGSLKRECQPDGTKSSMIKRDQPSQQRFKDRVNVSLLIYLPFSFSLQVQLSFQ